MTTAIAPILRVENLSIGIRLPAGEIRAVDDVSFAIQPGEVLGIVGESGCGKSLTALSLLGLLPAGIQILEGAIIFNNERLDRLPEREFNALRGSELSIIFQEPMTSFNPLLRIGNQIVEALLLHGMTDRRLARERAVEAMGQVGLPMPEDLLRAYPHQLSGGMLQRVMIAMAVICQPKLLIADEPTTALDVTTQAQILRLLRHINQTLGTTILFISHDLGVINQLCDQVLVMYAGRLVERGTVGNVFWHPVHEYTKGLIGSIPNRKSKGQPLANIPGKVPTLDAEKVGCAFAPRCPVAQGRCFSETPQQLALSEFHSVDCFLADPESEMEYVRI
ncbi:MAG: ABC transporter ATP-binding protein [Coriobacteriales bacterium]|jgi:peptide/nickel transport system ATP-binding protein|nr:ABC transporter ATP-binding protein [Coriobacteriales bacterium]